MKASEYKYSTTNKDVDNNTKEVHIKWNQPSKDILKLNIDGAVKRKNDAAIGGVIKNSDGDWIMGFYQKNTSQLKKLQNPVIRHSYREGNKVAHLLAKEGLKLATYTYLTTVTTPLPAVLSAFMATRKEQLLAESFLNMNVINYLVLEILL
ncbi:hypothetical protein HAX54_008264 [Datura stramonium]|uniref:RNase H type-1 domain-containing protein n=1 Tax=Datura stramonium TaxID=4076 RepID=A0ABS8TEB7_DATST|nr:hypothetical protein [Datura stramonium]